MGAVAGIEIATSSASVPARRAHCLIYAVASFQSYDLLPENSQSLMVSMLGRSILAIADNDALSLLPD